MQKQNLKWKNKQWCVVFVWNDLLKHQGKTSAKKPSMAAQKSGRPPPKTTEPLASHIDSDAREMAASRSLKAMSSSTGTIEALLSLWVSVSQCCHHVGRSSGPRPNTAGWSQLLCLPRQRPAGGRACRRSQDRRGFAHRHCGPCFK